MSTSSETTRREFLARLGGLSLALAQPQQLLAQPQQLLTQPPDLPAGSFRLGQEKLPTRPIPGTTESLPIIGLGSSKPVMEIPAEGREPVAAVIRMLLERGGRVVDTSIRSEAIDTEFGRVLAEPDIRDNIFLATKINTPDAELGIAQMRQTQRVFGRRTMDLVQIESLRGLEHHWPRLREWKDSGEARYIGVTVSDNRNHERLESFMKSESPDFVHMNYSVVETLAEERLLPLAQDRGMAVLINRPFMNGTYFGRVSGRELPEWAVDFDCEAWSQFSLKYILGHPAVTCVLAETTNPEHMDENIQAGFGRLPDEATKRRMRQYIADF